jgi:recombination protein RecA
MGLEHEVVQKSGAWFAYGDERLGQGRENVKHFLKENASVRERILAEVYEKLGLEQPVASSERDEVAAQEEEGEPAERSI